MPHRSARTGSRYPRGMQRETGGASPLPRCFVRQNTSCGSHKLKQNDNLDSFHVPKICRSENLLIEKNAYENTPRKKIVLNPNFLTSLFCLFFLKLLIFPNEEEKTIFQNRNFLAFAILSVLS